jgi:hypothetical protein
VFKCWNIRAIERLSLPPWTSQERHRIIQVMTGIIIAIAIFVLRAMSAHLSLVKRRTRWFSWHAVDLDGGSIDRTLFYNQCMYSRFIMFVDLKLRTSPVSSNIPHSAL